MTGFLTALSTLAGFALLLWGVRQAVRQLVDTLVLTERDPEPFGCATNPGDFL